MISAINVRIDEIANFCTSLLGKRCCFWPTGESFYCNSNKAFSLGGERKRSNQIDFPSIKQSFHWNRMSLFLMSGLGLQLARFTVVNVILNLLEDLWPPKALVIA